MNKISNEQLYMLRSHIKVLNYELEKYQEIITTSGKSLKDSEVILSECIKSSIEIMHDSVNKGGIQYGSI